MKRIFALSLVSLFAAKAFAGDGGFDLWTCVSDSGRTSLTIFRDNFSGAEIPARIVLGIDGRFVTYEDYRYDIARPADQVCEDDCTSVRFSQGGVSVNNGEFIGLRVDLSGGKAVIRKGFLDPRTQTESPNSIALSCKTYHEGP
jgi:hypothetical protein